MLKDLPTGVSKYITTLEARLEQALAQLERSNAIINTLQKAIYGQSSEKSRYIFDGGNEQLSLFNEAETLSDGSNIPESDPTPELRKQNKPKRTKDELAKTLPVKEVIIEIPEADRICNICGKKLRPIGKELVRREITVIPAQTFVTETWRVNYACDACEAESDEANIVKAPVPEPVVKRGLASPSSIAHVLYQKFVNSMPFYRQEKDWKNWGVEISRATLANWVIYACEHWLLPLWLLLQTVLVQLPVVHADETVVQVLKEPGKTPQSESRMWVYCSGNTGDPPIILYEYQPGRAGEYAAKFLSGFKGFLQTDGYAGYNKVPDATHCGCWAHLRRKFKDALPQTAKKDGKAAEGLAFCQKLFQLESEFKDLSAKDRQKQRQERSKPVLDAFFAWVSSVNPLKGSKLAEAITYATNQREPLSAFLLDGRIELSNNRAENAVRPFAIGRKNWLFSDTVRGARSSAVAYSIIETAKANGLNPFQYLLYLFTELPATLTKDSNADLSRFLPWSNQLPDFCRVGKLP